jgi:hypothetical protein
MRIAVLAAVALALTAAFPSTATTGPAGAVRAFDTTGGRSRPCPPVDLGGRYVRGGCESLGSTLQVELRIRTVFGVLPFADSCGVTFDFTVDRDGRTWMDYLRIGGGAGDPCNDVRACAPPGLTRRFDDPSDQRSSIDHYPWRGRLHPLGDGRFVNRFDMCVDTCAGRYDGRVDFALERQGGEWVVSAENAPVGRSGLSWSGEWTLDPGRFALRELPAGR